MRILFVLCFVLLIVLGAFSVTQAAWQCSGFVGTGGRVAISGDYAAIGYKEVEIYRRDRDGWKFHQRIECPEEMESQVEYFCDWVSMRNDLCVVGSIVHSVSAGSVGYVFIYRLTDGQWLLEEIIPTPYSGECYASSVDVDGDVCAVWSYCWGGDEDVSELHLYRFDGEQWNLEKTFADAHFGKVRGDRCAMLETVPGDNGNISTLCIFRYEDNEWIEEFELEVPNDFHLWHFDFSDDRLAVIADDYNSGHPNQKVVLIIGYNGVYWDLEAKLTSPYGAEEYFGGEVVISENVCVVGSGITWWEEEEGQDFVYELIDNRWVLTGRFEKSLFDPLYFGMDYYFGVGVACDKDTILATAYDSSGYSWVYSFEKCPAMDFDGDCMVGVGDLRVFADEWLTGRR